MLKVIDGLQFAFKGEKEEWQDAASSWRLPYWDWGLPNDRWEVPELFTTDDISIRAPKAADGTLPTPDKMKNPLSKYQVNVNGKAIPMGQLDAPYTIHHSIIDKDAKPIQYFPVRHTTFYDQLYNSLLTLASGTNAPARAGGPCLY